MSGVDDMEMTVFELTPGEDGEMIIGPSRSISGGMQENLGDVFERIYESLGLEVPLEDLEWVEFPFGEPIPSTDKEEGSGGVRVPATLHSHQTPESLRWKSGVRIYYKRKTDKIDYFRAPKGR
ncbi:hypothetical protein L486_07612 [Kwoniella mangroviensis CBS 10435]|uniref:Uncharacterized protein n=1 Tax=Kwoniella mangroviensis CBS 10435 TaxID=1331196 RepID=A0A1B9IH65_9TREE|nr:uncharacterized protein I203_03429 [Kwoniella mangroviensis CBS 8507]OCF54956.1 hypothetical protein L486_07612 [Kwoniella mangroviensis CBS 10435]OCF67731.1 hypothetical protein I203_03429 [Kwoniella mangroviensis CBS 8507]